MYMNFYLLDQNNTIVNILYYDGTCGNYTPPPGTHLKPANGEQNPTSANPNNTTLNLSTGQMIVSPAGPRPYQPGDVLGSEVVATSYTQLTPSVIVSINKGVA